MHEWCNGVSCMHNNTHLVSKELKCRNVYITQCFCFLCTDSAIDLEDIPNEDVNGTMQHETAEGNIQPNVSSQEVHVNCLCMSFTACVREKHCLVCSYK